MDATLKKEKQAIKLLQSLGGEEIELAYSGGKDSEICRVLAEMAGINVRLIHKNTTIDKPGTLEYCKSKGAEIMQPKIRFLDLVARKGFPTRRARFCCEVLKEYKVLDTCIIGVRRAESRARFDRYQEPIMCRMYPHNERVNQVYPILEWTTADEKTFIESNNIQLHPTYYDSHGQLDVTARLGCIGCPLRGDKGRADFKMYPKMLRAWCRSGLRWWDAPRDKPLASREKFFTLYGVLYSDLFSRSYEDFLYMTMKNGTSWHKTFLEDYFKVTLP